MAIAIKKRKQGLAVDVTHLAQHPTNGFVNQVMFVI